MQQADRKNARDVFASPLVVVIRIAPGYLSCAANRAFYFMQCAESTNFRCIRAPSAKPPRICILTAKSRRVANNELRCRRRRFRVAERNTDSHSETYFSEKRFTV